MNVQFYLEPYKNRNEGYKTKFLFLAEWFCNDINEIKTAAAGMVIGCSLKYKRFRVSAYDKEGKNLTHAIYYRK